MRVLECSSKGDKRFSAFYAKVSINNKLTSIENHYQLSKRFDNYVPKTWRDSKGKKPTHFVVGKNKYEMKYFSMWYKALWLKYLDKNPDLVEYAMEFDNFNDIFKGKALNCQADVIRQYVKEGRSSILNEIQPFLIRMKELRTK